MFKGTLPDDLLAAALEALPVEFSILDADDKVRGWNRHETRIFRRSENVLGRDVRKCHPSRSLGKVERILAEMKQGTRETAEFWIDKKLEASVEPEKIFIQYVALRDPSGKYLGCMECSQKISHLQSLEGEKRLLD